MAMATAEKDSTRAAMTVAESKTRVAEMEQRLAETQQRLLQSERGLQENRKLADALKEQLFESGRAMEELRRASVSREMAEGLEKSRREAMTIAQQLESELSDAKAGLQALQGQVAGHRAQEAEMQEVIDHLKGQLSQLGEMLKDETHRRTSLEKDLEAKQVASHA